jgi:general nucleoside transport system permease protein
MLKKFGVASLGIAVILVLTLAIAGLPVIDSLKLIFTGAFGDTIGLSRTAIKATPLLLTALGMVVAWRAGMHSIGGEGQFLIGGLMGALIAKIFLDSAVVPLVETLCIVIASMFGGAIWAGVAAWLHARRGVQVVISTILLNFVAIQLVGWAVEKPLQEIKHQLPQTDQLPTAVMLWRPDRQLDFHAGVVLAVLLAPVIYIVLYRTVFGFRIRLVGANAKAARAARIDINPIQFQALALSGALCGLAGGVEFTGLSGVLGTDFSQGWGFMAIPVALIGGLHPFGVIVSAIFFGGIFAGTENLARFTTGGPTLVYIIQAVAVFALVGFRAIERRRSSQPEAA